MFGEPSVLRLRWMAQLGEHCGYNLSSVIRFAGFQPNKPAAPTFGGFGQAPTFGQQPATGLFGAPAPVS
jgi:hypothetical protein